MAPPIVAPSVPITKHSVHRARSTLAYGWERWPHLEFERLVRCRWVRAVGAMPGTLGQVPPPNPPPIPPTGAYLWISDCFGALKHAPSSDLGSFVEARPSRGQDRGGLLDGPARPDDAALEGDGFAGFGRIGSPMSRPQRIDGHVREFFGESLEPLDHLGKGVVGCAHSGKATVSTV